MYSLYDLFVDGDSIVKCIGLEYKLLDYRSQLLILINNMKSFNLLDSNSNNIVNDSRFYQLLFDIKYFNSIHLLDAILLELNNNISNTYSIIPIEIQNEILLNQTDLHTIVNFYNSSSHYHNLLNNSNFLKQLMTNILNSNNLKLLPGVNKFDYTNSDINNKNLKFGDFIKWYEHNYYTKNCINNHNPLICYVGALDVNDIDGSNKYYDLLNTNGDWITYGSDITYISPIRLSNLITNKGNKLHEGDKYTLMIRSLQSYPISLNLTDSDIEVYSQFISYIKNYFERYGVPDSGEIYYMFESSVKDKRLFKLVYNAFSEYNPEILNMLEFNIIGSNMVEGDISNYYEFIQCIISIDDINVYNQFLNVDNLTRVIIAHTDVKNEYIETDEHFKYNDEYLQSLSELLDLISSIIEYQVLYSILEDVIIKLSNDTNYSIITQFLTNYINNR